MFREGFYGFNANISFTFQLTKNLSVHPTSTFRALYLGINSYFKGLVKFMEIGNF